MANATNAAIKLASKPRRHKGIMPRATALRYMKNVSRSLGYGLIDNFTEANPTVAALLKESKDLKTDLYQSIGSFKANSKGYNSEFKSTINDFTKDMYKNLASDLRSGNWYNKARINKVSDEQMSAMLGIDFDDFGDFDADFGDSDLDAQASIQEDAAKAEAAAMDNVGAKVSNAVSTATIRSADYIVQGARANSQALYNLTNAGFSSLSTGLAAINSNIGVLMKLGEPLTQHMQNSMMFYTKTNEYQEKALALLTQIANNTMPISGDKKNKNKRGLNLSDLITADGTIDIKQIVELTKTKAKDSIGMIKDLLGLGGGAKGMLKGISASPLSYVIRFLTGIPFDIKGNNGRSMRSAMKDFNDALSGLFASSLAKVKYKSHNGIMGLIFDMLKDSILPGSGVKRKTDTANYEKGKVDWDGISRKALTEVIPTQLGKILSVLSGEPEMVFNYKTGKWMPVYGKGGVHAVRREREISSVRQGGGELYSSLVESVNRSGLSSGDKEKYNRQLENFFRELMLEDNGDFLEFLNSDFWKKNHSKYEKSIDPKVFKDMQRRAQIIRRKHPEYASRFAGNVLSARANHGRGTEDADNVEKYIDNNSGKFGSKAGSVLLNQVDENGKNMFFYLRGIYLNTGFVVDNFSKIVSGKSKKAVRLVGYRDLRSTSAKGTPKDPDLNVPPDNSIDLSNSQIERSINRMEGYNSDDELPEKLRQYLEEVERDENKRDPQKDREVEIARRANSAKNEAKGFVKNKIDKFSNSKLIKPIANFMNVTTDSIANLLDNITQGVNDFIIGKDETGKSRADSIADAAKEGLYKITNAFTGGMLDFIPKWMKDLGKGLLDKFKDSKFGQAFMNQFKDTFKGIGKWFFSWNGGFNPNNDRRSNEDDGVGLQYVDPEDEDYRVAHGSGLVRRKLMHIAASGNKENKKKKNEWKWKNTDQTFGDKAAAHIANKAAHEVANKITDGLSNIIGRNKPEEEKKAIKNNISTLMKDAGLNAGTMGAGALIGGGVSLLTGAFIGPIAGAAVGAAAGFVAKSKTAQNLLFGEDDTKDEKGNVIEGKKGLLPKKVGDFMKKNLPDTAKGGGIGLVAGTLLGSPVLGAIVGSSVGFVKSSDKAKNVLFGGLGDDGNRKGGVVPKEVQDAVKKAFPRMTGGAALGLLAGPFGPVANLVFGSALGFATSTERFQQWFYGDKDNEGKRKFGKGGFSKLITERLFNPIVGIFDKLGNRISEKLKEFGVSIRKKIRQFLFKKVFGKIKNRVKKSKVGRFLGKTATGLFNLVTSPGKMINNALARSSLRRGFTYGGLTSEERMAQRENLGMAFGKGATNTGANIDRFLMAQGNNEQLLANIQNAIDASAETQNNVMAGRRDIQKELQAMANKYNRKNEDGNNYTGAIEAIYKDIANGDGRIAAALNGNGNNPMQELDAILNQRGIFHSGYKYSKGGNGLKLTEKDKQAIIAMAKDQSKAADEITTGKGALDQVKLAIKNSNMSEEEKQSLLGQLEGGSVDKVLMRMEAQLSQNIKVGKKREEDKAEIEKQEQKDLIPTKIDNIIDIGKNLGTAVTQTLDIPVSAILRAIHSIGEAVGGARYEHAYQENGDKTFLQKVGEGADNAVKTAGKGIATAGKAVGTAGKYAVKGTSKAIDATLDVVKGGTAEMRDAATAVNDAVRGGSGSGLFRHYLGLAGGESNINGEDATTIDQYGNVEENLGSSEVQQRNKDKRTILNAFKSMGGLGAGITGLTGIASSILAKLSDPKKKSASIFDKMKDMLFGDSGLLSGIFSFFTGGKGSGLVGKLLSKFSLATAVANGIGLGALTLGLTGKLDELGHKLGFAGSSKNQGLYGTDANGNKVQLATDENGNYMKDENGNYLDVNGNPVDPKTAGYEGVDTVKQKSIKVGLRTALGGNRFGRKTIRGIANGAKKVASGAKAFGRGVSKVGKSIGKVGSFIAKKVGKKGGKIAELISKGKKQIIDMLKGLGDNDLVKKVIGSKACEALKGVADKIGEKLGKLGSKIAEKASKEAIQQAAKKALVVLNIALAVNDFISGWQDASSTLGIRKEDLTTKDKLICAAVRCIKNLTFIGALIPDNLLLQTIYDIYGGDSYDSKKASANEELQAYNEEHGTNYTWEEYNKIVLGNYTTGEKIGNFFKGTWSKITGKDKKKEEKGASGSGIWNSYLPATGMAAGVSGISGENKRRSLKDAARNIATYPIEVQASISTIKTLQAIYNILVEIFKNTATSSAIAEVQAGTSSSISNKISTSKIRNTSVLGKIGSKIKNFFHIGGGSSGFESQLDSKYSDLSVGGRSMADNGCGPTSASMAIESLGGHVDMRDAVGLANHYQTAGGTDAAYFKDMFNRSGVGASYVSGAGVGAAVASGNPVVLMGQDSSNTSKANSPFGPNNHYVVANGVDSNGNINISDPELRGTRKYSPNILRNVKIGVAATGSGLFGIGAGNSGDSDNRKYIWDYLVGTLGLSEAGAAAIMGCWQSESSNNPNRYEMDYLYKGEDISTPEKANSYVLNKVFPKYAAKGLKINKKAYLVDGKNYGPGLGLAQWTGGRAGALMNYAKANNIPWNALATQLAFAKGEFEGTYSGVLDQLKSASDPRAAALIAAQKYEGVKRKDWLGARQNNAQSIFGTFSGRKPDTSVSNAPAYTTSGSTSSTENSSSSSSSSGSSNGGGILSTILNAFSSGFAKLFGEDPGDTEDTGSSSSTSGDINVVNAPTGPGNAKQKALVDKMKSIAGKLNYSMNGPRNPDAGSADCSSTVDWAYKKVTGTDIGSSTVGIFNNTNTDFIDKSSGLDPSSGGTKGSGPNESKLQAGDILLYSRPTSDYTSGRPYRVGHVEMYVGNGKRIGHSGPGNGPTIKELSSDANRYIGAKRLKEFINGGGSGSGLLDYGGGNAGRALLLSNSSIFSAGESGISRPVVKTTPKPVANNIGRAGATIRSGIRIDSNQLNKLAMSKDTAAMLKVVIELVEKLVDNTMKIDGIYSLLSEYCKNSGNQDLEKLSAGIEQLAASGSGNHQKSSYIPREANKGNSLGALSELKDMCDQILSA